MGTEGICDKYINPLCQYKKSLKNFHDMYRVIITAEKSGKIRNP